MALTRDDSLKSSVNMSLPGTSFRTEALAMHSTADSNGITMVQTGHTCKFWLKIVNQFDNAASANTNASCIGMDCQVVNQRSGRRVPVSIVELQNQRQTIRATGSCLEIFIVELCAIVLAYESPISVR